MFTTVLFDNMWRIQNQTTFVCHILVPKKATEKINKAYFDHIVALSALKSPVATEWLPPPPNWVKINFDVARGVAKNFYMGGPIRTMKVEIDNDEYHRCMDSLYF